MPRAPKTKGALHRNPGWAATIAACLLGVMVSLLPAQTKQDEILPLPTWDRQPPPPAGLEGGPGAHFNNLLPQENTILPPPPDTFDNLETGPRLADGPPNILQGYGEMGPHDLGLFLRGGLLDQPGNVAAPARPTPPMSLRDVPSEFLKSAYKAPANEYLLDPQTLVSEVPRQDLERLLEFHASDSRIRLYILVLDSQQKLPASAVLEKVAGGALTRQNACLAIYPLGEPWRARFLVSQSVQNHAPAASLTDLAEDCMKDALQATDPVQQLHRFTVRLSTRLFWLEKHLPAPSASPSGSAAAAGSTAASPPSLLSEVASAQAMAAPAPQPGATSPWVFAALISICLLSFCGLLLGFHLTRRPRHKSPPQSHVWLLPDPEMVPRLGGAFSGGAGAMVNYRE